MNDFFENNDEHDIGELIQQYQDALKNNKQVYFDEESLELLIDHYEFNNDYKNAHNLCDLGMANFGFNSTFYARKASLYLDQQDIENAEKFIEIAEKYDARDLDILFVKTQIHIYRSEHPMAIELLHERLQDDFMDNEDRAEIFLELASVYEDLEDYEKMFDVLKKAALADNNNEEAFHRLWLCAEMADLHEQSMIFHQQIIEQNPFSVLAWYNLGNAYFGLYQYEKAIDAYEYIMAINNENDFVLKDIAESYYKLGNHSKAIEHYNELLALNKDDEEAFFCIGLCYEQEGNFTKARQYYEKATRIDNAYDEAYFRIGECFLKQQKWTNALNYYKKAVKIDENQGEYYIGIAKCYIQLNEIEKAITNFHEAVQRQPMRLESWIEYINALYDISAFDLALQTVESALKFLPNAHEIRLIQTCIYLEQKSYAEAQHNLYTLGEHGILNADTITELNNFFGEDEHIVSLLLEVKKAFSL